MRAITIPEPGAADSLVLDEVPDPDVRPGEVLVDVAAAGVNRADVMQRLGHYPPPEGASEYPGLEVSGRISALGEVSRGGRSATRSAHSSRVVATPNGWPCLPSSSSRCHVASRWWTPPACQ